MPIAYNSVTPDTESSAGVTELTSGAWTIGGADRIALGFIGTGDVTGANPTGMKWRGSTGDALTQIGSTLSVGTHARLSAWRLANPSAESNTSYGNWAASQGEACIGMVSYTGADGTVGTPVTNTGAVVASTAFTASVNVSTTPGDLVVAVAFFHETATSGSTTATPAGGSTGRYDIEATQIGGWGALQVIELVASGGTTTMSVDFADAGARNGNWGIIAFVVNAQTAVAVPLMGQACL